MPHLRNPSEKLFAASRVLPGRKPEPSCKVAPAFEDAHWRRKGLDRHDRDRPHARHGLEAPRRRSLRGFASRRLFEHGDLLRQSVDLIEKDARQLHNEKRKRRPFILDRLCKRFQIRGPLWATTPCSDK